MKGALVVTEFSDDLDRVIDLQKRYNVRIIVVSYNVFIDVQSGIL